jgi:hypothetical protein
LTMLFGAMVDDFAGAGDLANALSVWQIMAR